MLIPWFGYVGKYVSMLYSGYSNTTGFELIGYTPSGNNVKLQTNRYHPDMDDPKIATGKNRFIRLRVTAFLGALAIMYGVIPHDRQFPFASLLFLYATTLALSHVLEIAHYLIFSHQREVSEWHSCEHKAAMLLESDLDITRNNFMRSPKTVIRCGSIEVITLLEWYITLSLLGYSLTQGITFLYLPVSFAIGSVLFARLGVTLLKIIGHPQSIGSFLIEICVFFLPGLPAMIPALLFERLLLLAPPSPEKITATMNMLRSHFPHRIV